MLTYLFNRLRLFRIRYLNLLALILPLVLFTGMENAQAALACYRSQDLTHTTTWTIVPSGSGFKNGDIVASTLAYTSFRLESFVDSVAVLGSNVGNSYNAVPLRGMPGLGLVVRWSGSNSTENLTLILPTMPPETVFSSSARLQTALKGQAKFAHTLTLYYRFQLVVIDANLYEGGKLGGAGAEYNKVRTIISTHQTASSDPVSCIGGVIDLMGALNDSLLVPELPRPILPSCSFSADSLAQLVTLGPIGRDQIPLTTSPRIFGETGQSHFLIKGTGCAKNTKLNFYLTDVRDMATIKTYILTSNPAVGIRMFHGSENDPVSLGPAPSGS